MYEIRRSDAEYLRGLLTDREAQLRNLASLIHASDSEKFGYAVELQLISGIREALDA